MIVLAFIPIVKLIPFAIFGLFAVGAWLVLERLGGNNPRAYERLEELKNPQSRRNKENSPIKQAATMTRVLAKASPMAKPLQPKSAEEVGKISSRLSYAGFRGEGAVSVFLGVKFIGLLIGLGLSGITAMLSSSFTQTALIYAVCVSAAMFYLPDALVWFLGRRRKDAIFFGLPDVLDLLVVCVEAGLGLDQAMRKVSEEMKNTCRVVAEEFSLCNFQLQMGRRGRKCSRNWGLERGSMICAAWRQF